MAAAATDPTYVINHYLTPYSEQRDGKGEVIWQSGGPAIYRCDQCGSLVSLEGQETHTTWHALVRTAPAKGGGK